MVGSHSTSNDNKDSKDQVLRSGTKKDLDTKSSNKKKDAEKEDSKLEKARKSTIKLIQMADSKNLAKIDKLFRDLFESSREKEEMVTKKDEKPSTEYLDKFLATHSEVKDNKNSKNYRMSDSYSKDSAKRNLDKIRHTEISQEMNGPSKKRNLYKQQQLSLIHI